MQRKAKIFINKRSQAVRLPEDFQLNTKEVYIRKEGIRKEGSNVVPSSRPAAWSCYLAEAPVASATLMGGIEKRPVQERVP